MNLKNLLYVGVLALGVSFIGTALFSNPVSNSNGQMATAAAVLERGEIRSGYAIYPPYFIKDPNTGEFSGIYYDIMEKVGSSLDIKINWVEEISWATFAEGFSTNRYDVVASGFWATPARAKVADFTVPLFYNAIGVYVRFSDNRFVDINRINNRNISIIAIDGEVSAAIAQETFPNAQIVLLPQDTPVSQLLLSVITHKVDVAFAEVEIGEDFLANNPETVKNVAKSNPVRIFPSTIILPKNNEALKTMFNAALEELINNGTVDAIVKKYAKYPDSLYPVAKPYSVR